MNHRGHILLLTLVFFGIFLTLGSALMGYVLQYSTSGKHLIAARQAHYLAEAGIDQAAYQLNQSAGYTGETDTALGAGTVSITVTNIDSNTKRVTSTAYVPDSTNPIAERTVTARVGLSTSVVSFHFGVQVGQGGVTMSNGARINGNLYSNGNVSGGTNAVITDDATAAGSGNSISGLQIGGTAWAASLSSCSILGDALYQTTNTCSVGGTQTAGTEPASPAAMPISQAQIDEWKDIAAAGGILAGNQTVSGTQTMGPRKIAGNLTVNGTLYMTGPIWVEGNVTFGNNSSLIMHPSTGSAGTVLIADVPGSESTIGWISLSNNMTIAGNGNPGSYPMLLSTNSGNSAIQIRNNATGVILYAPNGTITVFNNAGANQITAHRLHLNNNATVTYVTGLQNQNFSNGPGGSWTFIPGSYGVAP